MANPYSQCYTRDWRLYHLSHTIYLPSDLTWRLEGTTFFGSKCDTGYFGLETSGGVTEKKGGASIQYSNVRRTLSWAVIAMKRTFQAFVFSINFVQVQQSTFRDMAIVDASDDNFSLGFWSSVEQVV
jgi:hypothetical protein